MPGRPPDIRYNPFTGTGTSTYCLQTVHCFSREALRWIRGAVASLFLAGLLLAAPAGAQVWEFNTEGDRQGWSAKNNFGGLLAARSAGIRVSLASPVLAEVPVGARVEVTGTLGTVSWEKALLSAGFPVESHGAPPKPLGVSNRTYAGPGLSNAGLLMRTWGRVTARGSGFFCVDDVSGLLDSSSKGGDPNRGIRVAGDAGAVVVG